MRVLSVMVLVVVLSAVSGQTALSAPVPGSETLVSWDQCSGQLVAINPDGTGRHSFANTRAATDVSRRGPVTALVPQRSVVADRSSPEVLWAIDVDTGVVTTLIEGYNAAGATFSPDANRIAFVRFGTDPATGVGHADLYLADVVRDAATDAVTGVTGITRVVDLFGIGSALDSNASSGFAATGQIDFSRDSTSIVAVIYDDLWKIALSGNVMTSAAPLTRTKAFAERAPRWSPAGRDVIAYAGGSYTSLGKGGPVGIGSDTNIYALDLLTSTTRTVVTNQNRGQAGANRDAPTWSPDASLIGFSASGPNPSRKAACPVNLDIFKIRADGSASAINVTATIGSGMEVQPHWSWR